MSDDPLSVLNLKDEPELPTRGRGVWWIVSLFSLGSCIGAGFLVALSQPHRESDWLGMSLIVPIFFGIGLGALLCVAFATVSLVRKERGSLWALLAALPCGALLMWALLGLADTSIKEAEYKAAHLRLEQYTAQLRKDPEVGLREKWYESKDNEKFCAYRDSFSDSQVPYSTELLQRIYDGVPKSENYVFMHPGCSSEFLAAHFQEACDHNWLMLQHIVSNPNTPIELVDSVARSKQLHFSAVRAAQEALKRRNAAAQQGDASYGRTNSLQ
jgi:hypothetical protein